MSTFWFAVLAILWLNIFALVAMVLIVRRERRFDRFVNQAMNVANGDAA